MPPSTGIIGPLTYVVLTFDGNSMGVGLVTPNREKAVEMARNQPDMVMVVIQAWADDRQMGIVDPSEYMAELRRDPIPFPIPS